MVILVDPEPQACSPLGYWHLLFPIQVLSQDPYPMAFSDASFSPGFPYDLLKGDAMYNNSSHSLSPSHLPNWLVFFTALIYQIAMRILVVGIFILCFSLQNVSLLLVTAESVWLT